MQRNSFKSSSAFFESETAGKYHHASPRNRKRLKRDHIYANVSVGASTMNDSSDKENIDINILNQSVPHKIDFSNVFHSTSIAHSTIQNNSLKSILEIKVKTESDDNCREQLLNNFRQVPTVPTQKDLEELVPILPPNIIDGKYMNVDHYLDVQFRLLREDSIRFLREGIAQLKKRLNLGGQLTSISEIKVYKNAHFIKQEIHKNNLVYVVQFDDHVNWADSKRFLHGALLCFSSNNFKTVIFASVADRDSHLLKRGILMVQMEVPSTIDINRHETYVIIETSAYFEANRYNLSALKEFSNLTFPFEKYLVEMKSTIDPPAYFTLSTTFDFSPLLKPMSDYSSVRSVAKGDEILVVLRSRYQWPTYNRLGLDESQYNALKTGLTKELAIIQGPPGTGKTYIGLRIVQLLLHNWKRWNEDESPILIVCFTNHALDQFLEGILYFTRDIARIGGGCSNRTLEDFKLWKLKQNTRRKRGFPQNIYKSKMDHLGLLVNLRNKFNEIADSLSSALDTLLLREEQLKLIAENHYASLKYYYWDNNGYLYSDFLLTYWLNLESNNDNLYAVSSNRVDSLDSVSRYRLDAQTPLSEGEVTKIDNVWEMFEYDRWRLYKYWFQKFIELMEKEKNIVLSKFQEANKKFKEIQMKETLFILNKVKVIGMTTTGAAKNRKLVKALEPKIVLIEEAAEILEAHTITTFTEHTKHAILIGDHQQLRPITNVHELAVKYHFDVSLFERLVRNGLHFSQLVKQHRMRPEIAELLVPHIYPKLVNHKSVSKYENIQGIERNVFFVSHKHLENNDNTCASKYNNHEARYLVALCKYLLKQGYTSDQITILVTYSGQLNVVKRIAATENLDDVRMSSVDSFQGEESDIILISFVRSNNAGRIGFLKTSNRVCVALSRAKKGLFCIGNFNMLSSKSELWKNIVVILEKRKAIGSQLRLQCPNHPDVFTDIESVDDFRKVPQGGCLKSCEFTLPCGHTCPLPCHSLNKEHCNIKCFEKCLKVHCKEGHVCRSICFGVCGPCKFKVTRTLPNCEHTVSMLCHEIPESFVCINPCEKFLDCGHKCKQICGKNCSEESCSEKVDVKLPTCDHIVAISCSTDKNTFICPKRCQKTLLCGHTCKQICGQKCDLACREKLTLHISECEHTVSIYCHTNVNSFTCPSKCERRLHCGHICAQKCGEVCRENVCQQKVPVVLPCGHEMQVECKHSQNPNQFLNLCKKKCNKLLQCGHICSGTCSSCYQSRLHKLCLKPCQRILICGHRCELPCSVTCRPCKRKCENYCDHTKCFNPCGIPCIKCKRLCVVLCEHQESYYNHCNNQCSQAPCGKPCKKLLKCKHHCVGLCCQPCPPCAFCEEGKIFVYGKDKNTSSFILLEDCGHAFEVEWLTSWLNAPESGKFEMKKCPECNTVIRRNQYFSNVIKLQISNLELVKKSIFETIETSRSEIDTLVKKLQVIDQNKATDFAEIFKFLKQLFKFEERFKGKKNLSFSDFLRWDNLTTILGDFLKIRKEIASNVLFLKRDNFVSKLSNFAEGTQSAISDYIRDIYKTSSEQQLKDLTWEVHRLKILNQVIELVKKNFATYQTVCANQGELVTCFEKVVECLCSFRSFCVKDVEQIYDSLEKFSEALSGKIAEKEIQLVLNPMNVVLGPWFKCFEGHMYYNPHCDVQLQCNKCVSPSMEGVDRLNAKTK